MEEVVVMSDPVSSRDDTTRRDGERGFTWRAVPGCIWRLVKPLLPALRAAVVGYLVKRLFE